MFKKKITINLRKIGFGNQLLYFFSFIISIFGVVWIDIWLTKLLLILTVLKYILDRIEMEVKEDYK